ncbi:MAG: hypothetical protein OS130_06880 [Thermodesulfobacteriota bacterium]|jgi:hypothetical protein|nr:MAG: hypothetical protein OS130_06880 [Thermodesulfobacteriota bacterium]
MKRQTGRFLAVGDDGRRYTVYVYTDFIETGENQKTVVEGLKELRTSDGLTINRLKKGEYQIEQTGVILRTRGKSERHP